MLPPMNHITSHTSFGFLNRIITIGVGSGSSVSIYHIYTSPSRSSNQGIIHKSKLDKSYSP